MTTIPAPTQPSCQDDKEWFEFFYFTATNLTCAYFRSNTHMCMSYGDEKCSICCDACYEKCCLENGFCTCAAGQYFNVADHNIDSAIALRCDACPVNSNSVVGSRDVTSCQCNAGFYLSCQNLFPATIARCEPFQIQCRSPEVLKQAIVRATQALPSPRLRALVPWLSIRQLDALLDTGHLLMFVDRMLIASTILMLVFLTPKHSWILVDNITTTITVLVTMLVGNVVSTAGLQTLGSVSS